MTAARTCPRVPPPGEPGRSTGPARMPPVPDLDHLDNDLAGWLDRVLIRTGVLAPSAFETAFTAIVQAAAPDPLDAWTAFYRNTLSGLLGGRARPGGTIAEWAPIHTMAESLVLGSDVLELGCCFGFLSLRLASAGRRVTALDLSPGTVRLLCTVAARLGIGLTALVGDATAIPLADRCADTVLAVHLLEHLPESSAGTVLTEMLRVARRRVIVAVPYEDEPNAAWGHVRRFDAASLTALGAQVCPRLRVLDHHGGWLVLDR